MLLDIGTSGGAAGAHTRPVLEGIIRGTGSSSSSDETQRECSDFTRPIRALREAHFADSEHSSTSLRKHSRKVDISPSRNSSSSFELRNTSSVGEANIDGEADNGGGATEGNGDGI